MVIQRHNPIERTIQDGPQPTLTLLHGKLDEGSLGDILGYAVQSAHLTIAIELHSDVIFQPSHGAVGADQPIDDAIATRMSHRLFNALLQFLPVLGMNQRIPAYLVG